MTLVINGNGRATMVKLKRINLDAEPCPTIMNEGIGGVYRRGWQYWIEGGGAGPLNRVPRDGATMDDDPEAFGEAPAGG